MAESNIGISKNYLIITKPNDRSQSKTYVKVVISFYHTEESEISNVSTFARSVFHTVESKID